MRISIAAYLFLANCMVGEAPPQPGSGSQGDVMTDFDEAMLAIGLQYKSSEFTKLTSQPYASALGPYGVNMYVHGDVDHYAAIHPQMSGSNVTVAVGTVIVREVVDKTGATTELTMIAKGPAGYDPTLGDWWFADTDAMGEPIMGALRPVIGRVADCHGCHVPRVNDDYLFGVP